MSEEASVKPGDVLAGKYRVERVIGVGGMGYVVAAIHLQLDQRVAIKFLRPNASEESNARFLREAKAVVKLKDEHIAKVFDVGTLESGEPYIVMEHLEGKDLAELVRERDRVPASEASEYILQACEALAEAHGIGIIHRDIKLANLFVTRGPTGGPLVKVLDFGISKVAPLGGDVDMTKTESMLGSPRFMSPEQMRDPRSVDGRSDVWSLGVVLYRLVSGRAPFEADTLGRLLTMVMHEAPPPLAMICPELPAGFGDVVARCLEKEPAHRFATVADLARALVAFTADPTNARSAADRVLAVQSAHALPPPPATTGSTGPLSHLPKPSDGTASSWSGTHGGGKKRSSPFATLGLGLALAGLLVSAGLYAKSRRDVDAARAVAVPTAVPSVPVIVPEPTPARETAPPVPAPTLSAPPAQAAAVDPAPVVRRRPATSPARPRAAPARPPRRDEGIPSTRD